MDETKAGVDTGHPASRPETAGKEHRRRAALWRAVAGMALALTLAIAIVAFEVSSEFVRRLSTYRTRIASLNQKVKKLSHEAVRSEKRLEAARKEIASRDRLKAILLAPDLLTIKLAPPSSGDNASGSIALSQKAGGGLLKAIGLVSPSEGQVYDVWWIMKKAPPAKAAEFRSGADRTATVYLDMPPPGENASACEVTLEPSQGGIEPSGPVRLKGRLPH